MAEALTTRLVRATYAAVNSATVRSGFCATSSRTALRFSSGIDLSRCPRGLGSSDSPAAARRIHRYTVATPMRNWAAASPRSIPSSRTAATTRIRKSTEYAFPMWVIPSLRSDSIDHVNRRPL